MINKELKIELNKLDLTQKIYVFYIILEELKDDLSKRRIISMCNNLIDELKEESKNDNINNFRT